MKTNIALVAMAYREKFGIYIPNEPTWPVPEGETFEGFSEKLIKSVADGIDYLTQEYGEKWYEHDKRFVY